MRDYYINSHSLLRSHINSPFDIYALFFKCAQAEQQTRDLLLFIYILTLLHWVTVAPKFTIFALFLKLAQAGSKLSTFLHSDAVFLVLCDPPMNELWATLTILSIYLYGFRSLTAGSQKGRSWLKIRPQFILSHYSAKPQQFPGEIYVLFVCTGSGVNYESFVCLFALFHLYFCIDIQRPWIQATKHVLEKGFYKSFTE